MADLPTKAMGAVVSCSVSSEGNSVGAAFRLVSVHTEKAAGRIGRAKLIYRTEDMASSSLWEGNDDSFAVGKKIRIEAGYDKNQSPVFEGIVVSHEFEIGQGNEGLLHIECRDHAFPLTTGHHSRVFTDSTDVGVIQTIIGEYPSLSGKVDNTSKQHGELVQYDTSDWDFILSLADRNGLVVITEGNKITVKKPADKQSPVLSLAYGSDIIAFRAGVSIGPQDGTEQMQGSITFAGSAQAAVGSLLELNGFGKHFNRLAYTRAVEHEIREGKWQTTVHLGTPAKAITEKLGAATSPASKRLPGIDGLHIATVTKLNEDPAKNWRIQVNIHAFSGKKNLVWARMASVSASMSYGTFLIPDVGDEVVVGFFNNDPSYPVVLGSLYSSARNAPYELTEYNDTRALVTREKMKLVFDERKKTITLETPGKNKIIISDENKGITLADQNGNKLVMNSDGITIESKRDLMLKANMKLKAEALNSASIQANTDLRLKGMNVVADANMSISVKGGATAELSSSGKTVVKGAIVMIN